MTRPRAETHAMRRTAALLTFLALAGPSTAADPVTAVASGLAPGVAAAAAAEEAAATARVRDLVARLASADYRVREAAGKELARQGDAALPVMRQVLRTLDDPEAGRRLEVLVKKMTTERLIAPKRVTLAAEKMPLKDLFAAVARQTGYKLNPSLGQHEKVRLTVNWKDKPFWEAVDEVCEKVGLMVVADGPDEEILSIHDNDSYNPHVWHAGPFRFVATNIGANRNVQLSGLPRKFAQPKQPEYLNLNFQVQAEPKNPIVSTQPPVLTKAVDDTGANLLPPADDQNRYYYAPYLYRGFSQYVGVNLTRAGKDATTIKELRGKVTILLLADTRPEVVVENVLAVKKKKFVGRTTELEIDSASEGGGGVTVTLTARQLNPNPDDYSWANTVYQRVELLDDAGLKWAGNPTNSPANVSPGTASMTLTFTPPAGNKRPGKPSRLQFVEWITHPREVEFVFKDVPLP